MQKPVFTMEQVVELMGPAYEHWVNRWPALMLAPCPMARCRQVVLGRRGYCAKHGGDDCWRFTVPLAAFSLYVDRRLDRSRHRAWVPFAETVYPFKLGPNDHIWHLDGNPWNNRPANLAACDVPFRYEPEVEGRFLRLFGDRAAIGF